MLVVFGRGHCGWTYDSSVEWEYNRVGSVLYGHWGSEWHRIRHLWVFRNMCSAGRGAATRQRPVASRRYHSKYPSCTARAPYLHSHLPPPISPPRTSSTALDTVFQNLCFSASFLFWAATVVQCLAFVAIFVGAYAITKLTLLGFQLSSINSPTFMSWSPMHSAIICFSPVSSRIDFLIVITILWFLTRTVDCIYCHFKSRLSITPFS